MAVSGLLSVSARIKSCCNSKGKCFEMPNVSYTYTLVAMWPWTIPTPKKKRMKKYSEDKFEFKSRLTPIEIIERLSNRTLEKKVLGMVMTDKDFIGRINQDSFEIIESSFFIPYGASCILKGTINQASTINLVTTLHKAFRMLFIIWLIAMTMLFLTFWIIDSAPLDGLLAIIIGMPIIATLFRLFLHGMYVLARNKGLGKIKILLEVAN